MNASRQTIKSRIGRVAVAAMSMVVLIQPMIEPAIAKTPVAHQHETANAQTGQKKASGTATKDQGGNRTEDQPRNDRAETGDPVAAGGDGRGTASKQQDTKNTNDTKDTKDTKDKADHAASGGNGHEAGKPGVNGKTQGDSGKTGNGPAASHKGAKGKTDKSGGASKTSGRPAPRIPTVESAADGEIVESTVEPTGQDAVAGTDQTLNQDKADTNEQGDSPRNEDVPAAAADDKQPARETDQNDQTMVDSSADDVTGQGSQLANQDQQAKDDTTDTAATRDNGTTDEQVTQSQDDGQAAVDEPAPVAQVDPAGEVVADESGQQASDNRDALNDPMPTAEPAANEEKATVDEAVVTPEPMPTTEPGQTPVADAPVIEPVADETPAAGGEIEQAPTDDQGTGANADAGAESAGATMETATPVVTELPAATATPDTGQTVTDDEMGSTGPAVEPTATEEPVATEGPVVDSSDNHSGGRDNRGNRDNQGGQGGKNASDGQDQEIVQPTEEPAVVATEEPVIESTPEPVVEATEEPVVEATEEPVIVATEEPATESAPEPIAEPVVDPVAQPINGGTQELVGDAPTYEIGDEMTMARDAELQDATTWNAVGQLTAGTVVRLTSGPVSDVASNWWYAVSSESGDGMVQADALAPASEEQVDDPAGTPVVDPVADESTSVTPVATGNTESVDPVQDPVRIELVQGDVSDHVTAGTAESYRVRLTNETDAAVMAHILVSNSDAGWGSRVTDGRTGETIDGPIEIAAMGSVVMALDVIVPEFETAGTENQTTIDVEIVQ